MFFEFILRGTSVSTPNFMTFCSTIVKTFQSKLKGGKKRKRQMITKGFGKHSSDSDAGKSQNITKIIRIHPLGILNVNPSNCWHTVRLEEKVSPVSLKLLLYMWRNAVNSSHNKVRFMSNVWITSTVLVILCISVIFSSSIFIRGLSAAVTNRLKLFPGLTVIKQMILAFGGGEGIYVSCTCHL